jgi:hypothetical protein
MLAIVQAVGHQSASGDKFKLGKVRPQSPAGPGGPRWIKIWAALPVSSDLGQIGADQVTALVQLSSIALRTIALKV